MPTKGFAAMTQDEREALLQRLEEQPGFLERAVGALAPNEARRRAADGTFAPVEQCWHLADLEREGFQVRIRRLLDENEPVLEDFDGARTAEERVYLEKDLREGIRSFAENRRSTLRALRGIDEGSWARAGAMTGMGRVTLGEIPTMIAQHDASHRAEITAWLEEQRSARDRR